MLYAIFGEVVDNNSLPLRMKACSAHLERLQQLKNEGHSQY